MNRYVYRIETNYSTTDQENWGIYLDATGAQDYSGTVEEFAQRVLDNQVHDLEDGQDHGQWRVLAWNSAQNEFGEDRQVFGTADDADAIAEIDLGADQPRRRAQKLDRVLADITRNRAGRLSGEPISVDMGQTLAELDAFAKFHRLSRDEAIRFLVTEGLKSTTTILQILASNGAEVMEDRATWGYIDDEGDQFNDQIPYEEGETIEDAIIRFQKAGKIPHGEFSVTREPAEDFWVLAQHPWRYTVTIEP